MVWLPVRRARLTGLTGGIEIGGTKCVALLSRGREIVEQQRVPTTGPATTLAACSAALDRMIATHGPIDALGIGSFGPLGLDSGRADFGRVTNTPKPGWAGTDLLGHFARHGVRMAIDTDVAGAALAEGRWGASVGASVHIYMTIGTGIGIGIVVDGRPVHGRIHPEAGHVRVRRAAGDAFAGLCPFHGDCLEGLASGPAIAARAGRAAGDLPADHPVWSRVADEVAEALAMLVLTLSPGRIVVGGGVTDGQPHLLPRIAARAASLVGTYVEGVADLIRPPGLGRDAGPLGTIAIAKV